MIGPGGQRVRESVSQPVLQSTPNLIPDKARWATGQTLPGGERFWSFIPVYFSHGNRFHSPNQSEFCLHP